MKLDRRGFVKFLVGGVVGTMLSPIPWKLTDDVAIWTQNWPWVPNPPNGANSFKNTISPFGGDGIGVSVRLIDDKRAVTLSGVSDNPINQGGMSPIDLSGVQYHYNQAVRVQSPMVFRNGAFRAISWEEATGLFISKLKALRDQGTPEKAALVEGSAPGTMKDLLGRFMACYGSPNYMSMPSASDTEAQILNLMYGASGTMGYDLENSDFIISFGCGILEGWGSQRTLLAYKDWRQEGSRGKTTLVQVAANASATSSKADEWVAMAPGTEGAVALGLAHVIVKENLGNLGALTGRAFGLGSGVDSEGMSFSGFRNLVLKEYAPDTVAQITGVSAEKIQDLARRFAKAKSPLALPGRGKGTMPGGLYDFMAVHSLNALVGAVNRTGGVGPVMNPPLTPWPETALDSVAEKGLQNARIDGAGSRYPFSSSLLQRFAEVVAGAPKSPVEMLIVYKSNPAHNAPSSKEFNRARSKVPFVVSFSSFWDETTKDANLVLPNHSFLERWEDGTTPTGVPFPTYVLGGPVLSPMFDTRSTADVILETAKALGGSVASSFPWKSHEDLLKFRVAGIAENQRGLVSVPGSLAGQEPKGFSSAADLWSILTENGCWYDPSQKIGKATTSFNAPSGKFEFYCNRIAGGLRQAGLDPKRLNVSVEGEAVCMAHFEPVEVEGDPNRYPLLMVPEELAYVFEGEVPSSPYMTKIWPDTLLKGKTLVIQINPEDAHRLHLYEGDPAVIESLKGSAEVLVHLFNGVRPGTVSMAEGFGHTGFDAYIRDKGANTRDMTTVASDPLSGMPLWWGTRVKLTKV